MTRAQELIEEALRIAHQDELISIFEIQDALKAVLKDVDGMVERNVEHIKPNEAKQIIKETWIEPRPAAKLTLACLCGASLFV